MDRFSKIIFSLLVVFSTTQVSAQIVTDRPDQTEASSTVGAGNLQIESGVLVGYEGEDASSSRQVLAPTTLFRYGITGGIELRYLNQFETIKTDGQTFEGISDLEVGAKIQIFKKEESATEVAFMSHLIMPTGAKELSNGKYGNINKLCVSHGLSDKYSLGYNIGYDYFEVGNGDMTYSLSLAVAVTDVVGFYVEPYGAFANMEDYVSNFDAGFTVLPHEDVQLDFSFGSGINNKMNYISVGISWLIDQD